MITTRLFALTFRALLLCGMAAGVAVAQDSGSHQSSGPFTGWNAGHAKVPEITVSGTIQQVVSTHSSGPAGLQVLVSSAQGVVNASVGPFLPEDVQQALSVGQQIQITGLVKTINGQSYLLARQLVVGGHQITIRNEHGFLGTAPSGAGSGPRRKQDNGSGSTQNGGPQ